MTEDNTKDGDRISNGNSTEQKREAGPDSDTPAETDEIGAETGSADNPADQEGLETESPSGVSADHPDGAEKIETVEDFDLNLLLDIPLEITVELGRNRVRIQELLELEPGSTVTLSKLEGEPVDILANDKLIARGEVVLQNKKYGIRITEITSRMNRIKSLH